MLEFREVTDAGLPPGVKVLEVAGDLDNYAVKDFTECLEVEIEKGHRQIVVDCSRLRFVSSMGLGTLVRMHAKMRKLGGDVKLASVRGMVADLFALTRVNKLFGIYPDISQAVASF